MSAASLEPFLALHRAGRLAEAEAGYRRCLPEDPAGAGFLLAVLALQQQRHAEAVEWLEPLTTSRPQDVAVLTNLSIALRHVGRLDEALDAARKAAALAPNDVGVCNALGIAALERGELEEALRAFESGLRLAPGQLALELHRGKCLHRLGRVDEAIGVLTQVAAHAPKLAEAWRSLGSAQAAGDRIEAALESSRQALALKPDEAEVRLEHAVALLRAGHVQAALRQFDAVSTTTPDDARAWRWLGLARLRTDDREGARAALQRSLALVADDPVARHFLASLEGELPAQIEDDYVRALFDDFADHFESTLLDRLDYVVPRALAQAMREAGLPATTGLLDLGCGTGLMAAELADAVQTIDGVDLSSRMLQHARAKGLYRELHEAELLAFLRTPGPTWDAVVAADVLIYMAELRPLFDAVRTRLAPGGLFAFSIECSTTQQTELPPDTGRYRHVERAVLDELAAAGFVDLRSEALVLRRNLGEPVAGAVLLARAPAL